MKKIVKRIIGGIVIQSYDPCDDDYDDYGDYDDYDIDETDLL